MELYWLPPPNAILSSECLVDGQCSVRAFGLCGVPLGTFASSESFDTAPRETVHRTLPLSAQTQQQKACTVNMYVALASYGYANMVSYGKVEAETALRNFGEVNVQETLYVMK